VEDWREKETSAEQARFFRASAHIVKSSPAILNFSGSGRLERERGMIGEGVGRRKSRLPEVIVMV